MDFKFILAMMFSFLNSFWKVSFAISPSKWAFMEADWFTGLWFFWDWNISPNLWAVSVLVPVGFYFRLDIIINGLSSSFGISMVRMGWLKYFEACYIASSFQVFIPSNLNLLILSQNTDWAVLMIWGVRMSDVLDLILLVSSFQSNLAYLVGWADSIWYSVSGICCNIWCKLVYWFISLIKGWWLYLSFGGCFLGLFLLVGLVCFNGLWIIYLSYCDEGLYFFVPYFSLWSSVGWFKLACFLGLILVVGPLCCIWLWIFCNEGFYNFGPSWWKINGVNILFGIDICYLIFQNLFLFSLVSNPISGLQDLDKGIYLSYKDMSLLLLLNLVEDLWTFHVLSFASVIWISGLMTFVIFILIFVIVISLSDFWLISFFLYFFPFFIDCIFFLFLVEPLVPFKDSL